MEKLYSISEVADKLGIASKTLRRWEDSGKFVGSRTLGGQRRYSLTDIQILDAIKHGTIPNSQDLLTIDQAASLFGVTPTTIVRWENEGKIHPLITAGITYYPRHRLLEKLDELKKAAREEQASPPLPEPAPNYEPTYTPPSPHPALAPLNTHFSQPVSPSHLLNQGLVINILSMVVILLLYHLLLNRPAVVPTAPSLPVEPQTSVLDSILDKSGNLKSRSLTTSAVTLSPAAPPAPVPGSLYFDAGSQTLKLYTNSWGDIKGSSLISGTGTIRSGKSSGSIDHQDIKAESMVNITFNSDYAPARKYWVTVGDGSFTVHTDLPVAEDSPFSYILF